MTMLRMFRASLVATVVASVLSGVGASAAMPEGEFACQVLTAGGSTGLVLVQSDSMATAIDTAKQSRVQITKDTWGEVAGIVQCIDRTAGQTFADKDFQAVYENTPL